MANSRRQPIEYFTDIEFDDEHGFRAATIFRDCRFDTRRSWACVIHLSKYELASANHDIKLRAGEYAHRRLFRKLEVISPTSIDIAREFFGPQFQEVLT